MKSRPNKNYILQLMRDGDMADPWGTAMAWAFACAENLAAEGLPVPSELGYQMSPLGPVIESYEDMRVQEYLGYDSSDSGRVVTQSRADEVTEAARILSRYLDWLRAAGMDY